MHLKDLVRQLTDLIWAREEEAKQPVEALILGYVQEAVAAELEYRRRMRDLDRRLAELEGTVTPSASLV